MKDVQLSEYLSPDQLIALAETYGGTRLYVPQKADDDHPLVMIVGRDGYNKMREIYGHDTIRVPLCIALRINHHHAAGMSNAQIASRLTMTEPGVVKALARLRAEGELLPKSSRPRTNVQNVQGINHEARCLCCKHYNPERSNLPVFEQAAA